MKSSENRGTFKLDDVVRFLNLVRIRVLSYTDGSGRVRRARGESTANVFETRISRFSSVLNHETAFSPRTLATDEIRPIVVDSD